MISSKGRVRRPLAGDIVEICALPHPDGTCGQYLHDDLIEAQLALGGLPAQRPIDLRRDAANRLLNAVCLLSHAYMIAGSAGMFESGKKAQKAPGDMSASAVRLKRSCCT